MAKLKKPRPKSACPVPAEVVLVKPRRRVRRKKARRRDSDCCPPRDDAGFARWMLRQRELKILRDRFYPDYREDWLSGADIGCKVVGGTTTVAVGNTQHLSFTSELWDTSNFWSAGSPLFFSGAFAGKYLVTFYVEVTVVGMGATTDFIQSVEARLELTGVEVAGSKDHRDLYRQTYRTGDDLSSVQADFFVGVLKGTAIVDALTTDRIQLRALNDLSPNFSVEFASPTVSIQKVLG